MGNFFANMHIRRQEGLSRDYVRERLVAQMKRHTYAVVPDENQADGVLILYTPENSEWFSACSDLFEFYNPKDTTDYLNPLSLELKTDVMAVSCFDSDYMFMHLFNAYNKLDAWLNVGKNPFGPCPRKTTFVPWKRVIRDAEALKGHLQAEYSFCEDFWIPFGPLIGLPSEQGCICPEMLSDLREHGNIEKIYLKMQFGMFKRELPKLENNAVTLSRCASGEEACVFAVNRGGKSRGLAVVLACLGDETQNITFENVMLEYNLDKYPRSQIHISPFPCRARNGQLIYYWQDPTFPIPPKVAPDLPLKRLMDLEFGRYIGVRFTPRGDCEEFPDIFVALIPLANPEGKHCWIAQHSYDSMKAYQERLKMLGSVLMPVSE